MLAGRIHMFSIKIFVRVIDTAIEHCDDNVLTARRRGPCECGADVCTLLAATLSGIGECPLIVELRIVRKDRLERARLRKRDLKIGFGVFDFRERTVFRNDGIRVRVVEIVDRGPSGDILDAIFDAVVET